MARPVFKVHGFYRSGTGWLAALLRANVPRCIVVEWTLGSKHLEHHGPAEWKAMALATSRPSDGLSLEDLRVLRAQVDKIVGLVISKDPFALVASWRRFNLAVSPVAVITMMNAFYGTLLHRRRAAPERWAFVRYEDLLSDTRAELARLARIGGWHGDLPPVDVVPETIEIDGKRGEVFQRKYYYLDRRYLKELGRETVDLVSSTVDWSVMSEYGYGPIGGSR